MVIFSYYVRTSIHIKIGKSKVKTVHFRQDYYITGTNLSKLKIIYNPIIAIVEVWSSATGALSWALRLEQYHGI